MTKLTFKKLEDSLSDYDLLLFDLWGVVIEGGETYPGVVEVINRILKTKKVLFVSNAPNPNFIVATNLNRWGIKGVTNEMVVTSGDIARSYIKDKWIEQGSVPNILHMGKDRNETILLDIEHNLVDDIKLADCLLITAYRDEHEDIHEFDELLKQAAKRSDLLTICANPDTLIPNKGIYRYCPGYFASIVEQHGGKVLYTGKPKIQIYDYILKQHSDINQDRILMIGDTFDTDILGAKDAGIHSALVMTGNCQKIHQHHDKAEDKLEAIGKKARELDIIPTFITTIL